MYKIMSFLGCFHMNCKHVLEEKTLSKWASRHFKKDACWVICWWEVFGIASSKAKERYKNTTGKVTGEPWETIRITTGRPQENNNRTTGTVWKNTQNYFRTTWGKSKSMGSLRKAKENCRKNIGKQQEDQRNIIRECSGKQWWNHGKATGKPQGP